MSTVDRYRRMASHYDRWSGEAVYRVGRRLAMPELRLTRGALVVDVGCGTGLNFALLQDRIGPTGRLVGLDASSAMLDRARQRCDRAGWSNVELVEADANRVTAGALLGADHPGADAVLASYALSLMPDWPLAWTRMLGLVRPGGRVAVIDMARPTGAAAVFAPLVRAACALGGANIDAHPWTALERDCEQVVRRSAWGGHIQVAVGSPENVGPVPPRGARLRE